MATCAVRVYLYTVMHLLSGEEGHIVSALSVCLSVHVNLDHQYNIFMTSVAKKLIFYTTDADLGWDCISVTLI